MISYEKLYLLQNKICQLLSKEDIEFYLTGGTALSRVFLKHRYSDDLDFFVNDIPDYADQIKKVISCFENNNLSFEVSILVENYCKVFINENNINLKIDFVNDIPFRVGELATAALYPRIDNPMNILSNKISALGRYAVKDVADIIFLARSYKFNWQEMIGAAREKDGFVNPVTISKILYQFPVQKFDELNWIKKVSYKSIDEDLKIIARDIALGEENSLKM